VYIVSVGTVAVKITSLLRRRAAEIRRGKEGDNAKWRESGPSNDDLKL
jgi:hypothetical protein